MHQLASEIPLRLPDVRSACAVTGRQQRKQTAINKVRDELPIAQADGSFTSAVRPEQSWFATSAAAGPGHLPAPAPRVTTPPSSSRSSDGPPSSRWSSTCALRPARELRPVRMCTLHRHAHLEENVIDIVRATVLLLPPGEGTSNHSFVDSAE